MTEILWLDTETYSETPIRHGTYKYIENCELMLLQYAIDDEDDVHVVDFTAGEYPTKEFFKAARSAKTLVAQNSPFDRNVLKKHLPQIGWDIERWVDTMIMAYTNGLPGALAKMCEILAVSEEDAKAKSGKNLIQLFCKPQPKNSKVRRATRLTHPEDWAEFSGVYATSDIRAMRAAYYKMPRVNFPNGYTLQHWHTDQKINDRGFQVDLDLVEGALAATKLEQAELRRQTARETKGEVDSTTKNVKLLEYILAEHGVALPDLKKATLLRRLDDPDMPEAAKELIRIRLQATTTSTSKYQAWQRMTSADGRCRGAIQFYGAMRTGRAAGRGVQIQNLPSRGLLPEHEIELGIDCIKSGDIPDYLYPNVMQLLSSAIRGCIVAAPGKKLIVSDLSAIEGRVLSWLCHETWKLVAYRDSDEGRGNDLYELTYARSFNTKPETVTPEQRKIGKVLELACLHPDTQVLTDHGIKRIVEVLLTDKVWDGEAWVKHGGLEARGVKQVVNVGGIKATPDHLILTGQTWKQVRQLGLNENTLRRALATGSEGLRSLSLRTRLQVKWRILCMCAATAAGLFTNAVSTTCGRGRLHNADRADSLTVVQSVRDTTATRTYYQTKGIGLGSCLASPPQSVGATTRKTKSTKTTAAGAYRFSPTGGQTRMAAGGRTRAGKGGERSLSTSSLFRGGVTRVLTWIGETTTEVTNRVTYVLSVIERTRVTSAQSRHSKPESKSLSAVYDLVDAGARNRFTVISPAGAMIVHNCGYGGGVGAMVAAGSSYGFSLEELAQDIWHTLPEDKIAEADTFLEWMIKQKRGTFGLSREAFVTADVLKRLWREANPNIVKMWKKLEDAAIQATCQPGVKVWCGKKLCFIRKGNWLRMRLPSGRFLVYPAPRVEKDGTLTFLGNNTYTRKWGRNSTYSGKLAENACQAVARDVLYDAMEVAEARGYLTVLHVHDEIVAEAPDTNDFTIDGLNDILVTSSAWTKGLPLAAAGFESYRYKK